MSHSNNIITKPVDPTADVATVLGIASGDYGTLCQSANVNKWAKYKPVALNSLRETGKTVTEAGGTGADWWKGEDRATSPYIICGLELSESKSLGTGLGASGSTGNGIVRESSGSITPGRLHFSSDSAAANGFLYKLAHGTLSWGRYIPDGSTYQFRMLDFDGYKHDALSPMPLPPEDTAYGIGSGIVTIICRENTLVGDTLSLPIMNLPSAVDTTSPALSTFYMGILMYRDNYTDIFYKTATERMNFSGSEKKHLKVAVTMEPTTEGDFLSRYGLWNIRTFLSEVQLDSDSNYAAELISGHHFLVSEGVSRVMFVETTGIVEAVVSVAKWLGSNQGKLEVEITNTDANEAIFYPSTLYFEIVNSLGAVVYQETVSDFPTTPIGYLGSSTYSHTFTAIADSDCTMHVYLYGSCGSETFPKTATKAMNNL